MHFMNPCHYEYLAAYRTKFPNLPADAHRYFEPFSAPVNLDLKMCRNPVPNSLEFLWPRLHTCTLSRCRPEDVLQMLPLFSPDTRICITHAHMYFQASTRPPHAPVQSAVSGLLFRDCDISFMANVLEPLTAPRLQKLAIWEHCDDRSNMTVTALLHLSSRALTHLGVRLLPGAEDELAALLESRRALHLEELDVDSSVALSVPPQLIDAPGTRDILQVPKLRVRKLRETDDTALLQSHPPLLKSLWLEWELAGPRTDWIKLRVTGLEVGFTTDYEL
ncbi:hypothetical protein GGX14DRAFT_574628 [Mycena pura]|uniref:Uncharacterized protein n=1 Tax=Mycena pura TaxID=153505 RepID=A0AAD6UXK0_9AGAR|nr:hypothetical protein GGX14DRAFT_574628 [Mycena pura]